MINPKNIEVQKNYNPRNDFETGMEELSNSIIENGLLRPLVVKADKKGYALIDGERRLRACLIAIKNGHKIKEIPVFKERNNISEAESLLISFISNEGLHFSPMEEAAAFRKMMDCGMSTVEIGKKIGRSDQHVRDRLVLLDGETELREAVKKKKIPTTLAKKIIKKSGKDKELQKKLTREAASGKSGKRAVGNSLKPRPVKAAGVNRETFSKKELLELYKTNLKLFMAIKKRTKANPIGDAVLYGKVMAFGQLLGEDFDAATELFTKVLAHTA